jgi:hypothetical protein
MIQHKVSIILSRESVEAERNSFNRAPREKSSASSQWQIHFSGDVEHDNPIQAKQLLEELQIQIDKIRGAYSC